VKPVLLLFEWFKQFIFQAIYCAIILKYTTFPTVGPREKLLYPRPSPFEVTS